MMKRLPVWLLVVTAALLSGCGGDDTPPLGEVTGKVTLDGAPLDGVIVVFKPEVGRVATGTTNADGTYELEYAYQVPGCKVGPCKVNMEWPLGTTKAKALDAKYTSASELNADVKEGDNTFNFDLKSPGGKAKKLVIPD